MYELRNNLKSAQLTSIVENNCALLFLTIGNCD